jgi:hypothetical protein
VWGVEKEGGESWGCVTGERGCLKRERERGVRKGRRKEGGGERRRSGKESEENLKRRVFNSSSYLSPSSRTLILRIYNSFPSFPL